VVSRDEYFDIPSKSGAGSINQIMFDPQREKGYFHLWQVPARASEILTFTWHRPIEDFDAGGDNPDLPQEWILCLIYNLAKMMLPRYPVPPSDKRDIQDMAETFLFDMEGFGREAESVFVQPER
jgi:hypothetical protein